MGIVPMRSSRRRAGARRQLGDGWPHHSLVTPPSIPSSSRPVSSFHPAVFNSAAQACDFPGLLAPLLRCIVVDNRFPRSCHPQNPGPVLRPSAAHRTQACDFPGFRAPLLRPTDTDAVRTLPGFHPRLAVCIPPTPPQPPALLSPPSSEVLALSPPPPVQACDFPALRAPLLHSWSWVARLLTLTLSGVGSPGIVFGSSGSEAENVQACDFPRPCDPLLHIFLRSAPLSPQYSVGYATMLLSHFGPTYPQMQACDYSGLCTPLLHLFFGAGPTWLSRIFGMPPLGVASTIGTSGNPPFAHLDCMRLF